MALQKFKNQNVRKIMRLGKTSLCVSLPKNLITNLGWKEKQKVLVKKAHGGVLIKDWRR